MTVFFIVVASLAVLIRIYTRRVLLQSFEYDDYASILSWLFMLSFIAPVSLTLKAGAGLHMWDLQLKRLSGLLYLVNISIILYSPTVFFIKLSILLQYTRIFAPTVEGNMRMVVAIRICISTIFIFYIIATFFSIFQCSPREKIWNILETDGHCYDVGAFEKASGVFNIVSDFAILILPISSVWRLHMTFRKKLLTTAVFAIGFLTCATSIVRTYYTWKIIESSDESYLLVPFGLWGLAELSAGIVVGCFPIMPRFFRHVGTRAYKICNIGSSITKSSSYNQSARTEPPRTDTFIKIKNHSDRYDTGVDAQIHGEQYMLDELPHNQAKMAAGIGIPTRRDDLEHGLPNPERLSMRSGKQYSQISY